MTDLTVKKYQCDTCKSIYNTMDEAVKCETREVSQDKGVKIGDIIMITQGEGTGEKARVDDIFIYDKDWGHYAWEKYWHTVGINASLINSWGSRQLTFDSYEK